MEIKISMSEKMSSERQKLLEDRVLRVPKSYRKELGITVGEFVNLRAKHGEIITLQIEVSYKEDSKNNDQSVYVTDYIYGKLDLVNDKKNVKIVDEITLGTDPEFFVLDSHSKNILSASRWFDKWGEIGYDGLAAEIRPAPSIEVSVLVENIRVLLAKIKQATDADQNFDAELHAMSHYKSICAGFHLHYGIPKQLLSSASSNRSILNTIVRVLDYYIAIPGIIPEGMKDSGRRCAPFISYGKIGDYRIDHRTLEYRVPGAALLKHPILTKGLIALGATVVEDVISRARILTDDFQNKNLLSYDNLQTLYPGIPDMNTLFNIVSVPDTTNARTHLNKIKDDVRSMVGYNKRSIDIETFFSNIDTPFSSNLGQNWQLNNSIMIA